MQLIKPVEKLLNLFNVFSCDACIRVHYKEVSVSLAFSKIVVELLVLR